MYDQSGPACDIVGNSKLFNEWSRQFVGTRAHQDYGVTGTDFDTFYNAQTCCNAWCPTFTRCSDYRWAIYNTDTNNWLPSSDIAKAIMNQSFTQLAPWMYNARCRQNIDLNGPSSSSSSKRSILISGTGDVMVNTHHNTTPASSNQYWQHQEMKSNPRLRLISRDGIKLQNEIGLVYGRMESSEQVYVVIDVRPSPGVPEGRWIYSTREVYLTLPPHLLRFLAGELLLPEIKRYVVHCVNPWANNMSNNFMGQDWANQTEKGLAQAEVFAQLHLALRPVFEQENLKGELVLVDSVNDLGDLTSGMTTYSYDTTSKTYLESTWTNPVEFNTVFCFFLSIAISFATSIMLVYYLTVYGHWMLLQLVRGEELKIKMASTMSKEEAAKLQASEKGIITQDAIEKEKQEQNEREKSAATGVCSGRLLCMMQSVCVLQTVSETQIPESVVTSQRCVIEPTKSRWVRRTGSWL